jgi:ribosomal protein L34E
MAREKIISGEDFKWLNEQSDSRCWICNRPETVPDRSLAIDHDHVTNAVRGLLCTSCNTTLGGIRNPEWLRRAAEYLETAERAFGDSCRNCLGEACPKRLIFSDGRSSTYEFTCLTCDRRWRCSFWTNGLPNAWLMGGNPFPSKNRKLIDAKRREDYEASVE